jgi:hypothetical protein
VDLDKARCDRRKVAAAEDRKVKALTRSELGCYRRKVGQMREAKQKSFPPQGGAMGKSKANVDADTRGDALSPASGL